MIAGVRLADGVRPPIVHGSEDAERAQSEDELAVGIVVPPHDESAEESERAESPDDRPRIGLYEVVIVILRRGHSSGFPRLFASASSGRMPHFPPGKMCSSR